MFLNFILLQRNYSEMWICYAMFNWRVNSPCKFKSILFENVQPKPELTEFQKARFELIANAGADVKGHFPAMALHIGQIKNPCALTNLKEDSNYKKEYNQINTIFAKYRTLFAQKKIALKGLKYVQYESTSLSPKFIKILATTDDRHKRRKRGIWWF